MNIKWQVLSIGVVLLFTIALYVGSDQSLRPTLAASESVNQLSANESTTSVSAKQMAVAKSDLQVSEGVDANDVQSTEVKPQHPAADFDHASAIQEVEALLSSGDFNTTDSERLVVLQDQLTVIASIDRDLRAHLLSLLESYPSSLLSDFVLTILTQLNDPDVLSLGIAWIQSSDREFVLKGLEIVSQQTTHINNGPLLAAAEQLLTTYHDDPEVLTAAIGAMSAAPSDVQSADHVLNSITHMTENEDGSVRSASIFSIAHWARDASDLAPVIQALSSTDPDDRVSAAMALTNSDVVGDEIRNTLIARVADEDELWEVRRIAADSLVRFALSSDQEQVLEDFRLEQVRISGN